MKTGWLKLSAPYFEQVCRKIFDSFLGGYGFINSEADETGSVTYFKNNCFLNIYYYPEDNPNYSPMIRIGFVKKSEDPPSIQFEGIGLWYAIPESVKSRDYGNWTFSTSEELEKALLRIRDEVISVYAQPLWEEPQNLRLLVNKRKKDIEEEYKANILRKKKIEAQNAFRTGNYEEALKIYSEIDRADLSTTDLKRFNIAQKYLLHGRDDK